MGGIVNRRFFKAVVFLSVSAVLGLTFFLLWNRAWLPTFQPTIVAEMRFGKTNFAVVQTHDGFGLYGTSFFVQDGGIWKWFYLDHDTGYWWNAKLQVEGQDGTVRVLRGKRLVACFSPKKGLGLYTQRGLVYEAPIGWIEGDMASNWNRRKSFPDKTLSDQKGVTPNY